MGNLHGRDAESGDGGQSLQDVAENVDDGNPEDGFKLAPQLIGQHGAEKRAKVAKEGKRVVDHRGRVLAEVQLVLDVNGQDGCKRALTLLTGE